MLLVMNIESFTAPIPAKKPQSRSFHGDTYIDDYDWLRDKENPEVIAHLNAENAYAERILTPLQPLREQIAAEIKNHTQETDSSVPYLDGEYWYISRTKAGDNYPKYSRIHISAAESIPVIDEASDELLPGEEVFLDVQALSEGFEFFQLGGVTINDRSSRLAYSVDTTGGEVFDLKIVDLKTGEIIDDSVKAVGYGLEFSTDGSQIIYSKNDDAWRQCEIWGHEIGTEAKSDYLIHREEDEKFVAYFSATRNRQALFINLHSSTTQEVLMVALDNPKAPTVSIAGRVPGVIYSASHAGDHFLIVHNKDHIGFVLARQELHTLGVKAQEQWQEIYRAKAGERLEEADVFAGHLALAMRSGGLPTVKVILRSNEDSQWLVEEAWNLNHGGELDAIELSHNENWDAKKLRYTLNSFLTAPTVAEIEVGAGPKAPVEILKVTNVPNFDPAKYDERRLWATAADGTKVPISLVARKELKADGTNPGFLYGYGSYEIPMDPHLVTSWISLLDRGVVVAIAHVRGGGEMGREWYEDGKLLNKKNSFSDFVDSAKYLVESGWFDESRVAAEGGSAGGLLMGAIANLSPQTFRVVHAKVPFVDALRTILDPNLPLTVGEWEEWGNPLEDPEVYRYMKEYTPTENIKAVQYPSILATTSLNDIRVLYVEPAKWVAKLREESLNYVNEDAKLQIDMPQLPARPIIFKCEMVAGHGGKSGRYEKWLQTAQEYAFILNELEATELI